MTRPGMPATSHGHRLVPAGLLTLVGLGLGILVVGFLARHPDPPSWWRIEVLVTATIAAVVSYSGYWLLERDYRSADLWAILGWTVAGVAGGLVLAGGLYVHQTIEHTPVAEPAFLVEFLALVGAGLGVGIGILWRARRGPPGAAPSPTATDIEGDLGPVLPFLDEDRSLQQRWTVISRLVETRARAVPIAAFVVQLTREDAFPDDPAAVETLVYEEHLPVLQANGLVVLDEEIMTLRYVGPERVATAVLDGAEPPRV